MKEMLNNLFKKVQSWSKDKEQKVKETLNDFKRVPLKQTHEYLCKVDLTRFKNLSRSQDHFGSTTEHDKNLKNVLIVDDVAIDPMYGVVLDNIACNYNINPYENFNIYQSTGINSGIEAYKFIVNHKVDYAILDITLGSFCYIKEDSDQFVEIDGVDLGISILKLHPNAKILFCSAHILNLRHPTMAFYRDKLKNNTGLEIEDHYLNKLEKNKEEAFYKFLELKGE